MRRYIALLIVFVNISTILVYYYQPRAPSSVSENMISARNTNGITPLNHVTLNLVNGTIQNNTAVFVHALFTAVIPFYYISNDSPVTESFILCVKVSRPGGDSYDSSLYLIDDSQLDEYGAAYLSHYPDPPWLGEVWISFIPYYENWTRRYDITAYYFRFWSYGLLKNYSYTMIEDDYGDPDDHRAIAGAHIKIKGYLTIKGPVELQPEVNITTDLNYSMNIMSAIYYDFVMLENETAILTVPSWVDGIYNVEFNISNPYVVTYFDTAKRVLFNFTKWTSYISVENSVLECNESTPLYISGTLMGEIDDYGTTDYLPKGGILLLNESNEKVLYSTMTDSNGHFVIEYSFINEWPGKYDLILMFNGTAKDGICRWKKYEISVPVKVTTHVILDYDVLQRSYLGNQIVEIHVKLGTGLNKTLRGVKVYLSIGGQLEFLKKTDFYGYANFSLFWSSGAGNYTVSFDINNPNPTYYLFSAFTTEITIYHNIDTYIKINATMSKDGYPLLAVSEIYNITVILSSSSGANITALPVKLYIITSAHEYLLDTRLTNEYGVVSFIGSIQLWGEIIDMDSMAFLEARIENVSAARYIPSISKSIKIKVVMSIPTKMSITESILLDRIIITGTLYGENNAPLAKEMVIVIVDGKFMGSVYTDINGKFSFELVLQPGNHKIMIIHPKSDIAGYTEKETQVMVVLSWNDIGVLFLNITAIGISFYIKRNH